MIKRFVDKYTHEMIEEGTDLKNLTPERQQELIEAGVIAPPKEKKTKETKNNKHPGIA